MKWLAILLAFIATGVVIFKLNFPTYSYRYRLQVSLSLDEKVYTGSSVIEVVWECGPKIAGLGRCAAYLGGQAAVIDLGSRGVVVATLRTGENILPIPDGAIDAVWFCANAFGNQSTDAELPALPRLTGRRGLAPSNFPRLIWFANPADPNSAKKITIENVRNTIDPTARFTEAFVEITRDPIVVDIATKLPWYPALLLAQKGKLVISTPGQFQLIYNMFVGENS
ncbi:hypothetical protein [Bradyrhizobium sp. JYMT SZCCT0180]|uniref:hypothetical protein n=1 Tax=Bradyrhizobium sp. JYMT SZCCT0180 TaxID=2807666 RepID=UPI001BABE142|nr:hypothetical protein [Bradyrhizobium sp. JYMT SZCCT0180]MBR1209883.1 hypothetical protein [Bradyrhizobium sp. JYMT SZCCT0180]